ncbi:hypothetical protein D5086_017440 [Populus alba]|uniref:Uncharacterized protein n=1 Tax=Populus alba TaxID=43335 RepID=A0ACC4BWQ4_POPAL
MGLLAYDCAGSRAETVFPNLATSPTPGTLAGGTCSRDGIMGSDFVNKILFLARDLEEDLLTKMIQICHLVLADRFSWLPLLGSFLVRLLQLLTPMGLVTLPNAGRKLGFPAIAWVMVAV